MTELRVAAIIASTLFTVACGGFTTVAPTVPSSTPASALSSVSPAPTPAPAHSIGPDVPAGLSPNQQVCSGSVGPLIPDAAPCYLERYSCERYRFTMDRNGAVEVTLTWEGSERAMLIQLYRAGAGLVHEDLAPRGGPPPSHPKSAAPRTDRPTALFSKTDRTTKRRSAACRSALSCARPPVARGQTA